MKRSEKAMMLFNEGYACSQAIVMAFQDVVGINSDTLMKISLPLGGGISRLRRTCGAVLGMSLIVGLLFGSDTLDHENKLKVYEINRKLIEKFEEKRGTSNCLKLLEKAGLEVEVKGEAEKRTSEYYSKRPCGYIVYDAARVLEEYLEERGVI